MKIKATTMKTKARITLFGLVMAIALCYANFASAESNFATGGAAGSGGAGAAVNLDFQIVIPQFIYFQVGTAGAAIDQITFTPTAAEVANATAGIAGAGGDLGTGIVTVSLVSNAGGVDITESNNSLGAGLGDGAGNFISYAQINTATNDGNLPAPVLSDGGGTSVSIPVTVGTITNRQAQWTYTYDNPATPPAAGTYGTGGAATGGRVTYTAAIP
ncbi:MAG: hypothetical protein KJO61_15440 [Deltaproteobacteria bacterium]|nr:hypothetical protein [Deltaproteobacteria bacterium]